MRELGPGRSPAEHRGLASHERAVSDGKERPLGENEGNAPASKAVIGHGR